MLKLWCLLFLVTNSYAAEWMTGDFKVKLEQDSNGDWANDRCMKLCKIDSVAEQSLKLKSLGQDEMMGGKNPGSVLCHRIEGKVVYLKNDKDTQAFCFYEAEVVSLSRLTRKVLFR